MNNDTNTQEPIINLDTEPTAEIGTGFDAADRINNTSKDGAVAVGHEVEVSEVSEPEQTAA